MKIALNKICSKCNEEKSLKSFSKDAQRKDGISSQCKACDAARGKAYREANREKEADRAKAYRDAHPEKVAAIQKAYRDAHPEKISAINRAWYEANKEKKDADNKAWREANPEKVAANGKAWREANKEKVAADNKAWQKANPEKCAAKDAKRHAAKLKRTPPWLTEEHYDQITSIYAERVRLTKETGVRHEVDHILPLQGENVCGLHVPWNLRVITAQDNRRKSNKH